ncbi:hypothetical protein BJX68DRAFT_264834 [Aspergillus pseudodeflectus]|uniref:Uncharacterized protein n=1 Tax=Aspergillus pseudodeflectus TaxID=176178 RepID=A0ABR4KP82_9EURO
MHLFQLIIPSMLSLAAAAPTPELEARAGHARFGYTGSATCNAPLYIFDSAGCFPVASTARAIYVYENVNCIITTWSGKDCGGSSKIASSGIMGPVAGALAHLNECQAVPFGSVSVTCF